MTSSKVTELAPMIAEDMAGEDANAALLAARLAAKDAEIKGLCELWNDAWEQATEALAARDRAIAEAWARRDTIPPPGYAWHEYVTEPLRAFTTTPADPAPCPRCAASDRAIAEAMDLMTKAVADIAAALMFAGKQNAVARWTAPYVAAINAHDASCDYRGGAA